MPGALLPAVLPQLICGSRSALQHLAEHPGLAAVAGLCTNSLHSPPLCHSLWVQAQGRAVEAGAALLHTLTKQASVLLLRTRPAGGVDAWRAAGSQHGLGRWLALPLLWRTSSPHMQEAGPAHPSEATSAWPPAAAAQATPTSARCCEAVLAAAGPAVQLEAEELPDWLQLVHLVQRVREAEHMVQLVQRLESASLEQKAVRSSWRCALRGRRCG